MTRFRWLFAFLAVLVLGGIGWRVVALDSVRLRVDVIKWTPKSSH